MKKLMLLAFWIISMNAFAAPYFGKLEKFKQPDGTWVDVKLYGDEFYIRAEGLDGYTLIRDEATDWICYANLSGAGDQLLSTGIHYAGTETNVTTLRSNLSLPKHLKLNDAALIQVRETMNEKINVGQPLNRYQNESTLAPPIGEIKGLAIIVDFSDAPATLTVPEYNDFLNGADYNKYGNNGSIKNYFSDISGGLVEYENVVYGIYRAPKTFAEYDAMPYGAGTAELLGLTLSWIESKGFDFSSLTIANGNIRAINMMYTGKPGTWSKGMWYHKGFYNKFSADGVRSGDYNVSAANEPLEMNIICHENGHMIGEWPDTYQYNEAVNGKDGIGRFDIMCDCYYKRNPTWPNPYFLSRNGYGETIDVTHEALNVNDPGNSLIFYKYINEERPEEFFIIQAKRKVGRGEGYPDEGVTIWRVNTKGDNQKSNREIRLVHAGGDDNAHATACYKSGSQEFSDDSTPGANWMDGTPSRLIVSDFGAANEATMEYRIGPHFNQDVTKISKHTKPSGSSIYPNPITEGCVKINLSGLSADQPVNITIRDISGKTIYQREEKQHGVVSINTDAFMKGMYFITLSSDDSTVRNYKLIKQ